MKQFNKFLGLMESKFFYKAAKIVLREMAKTDRVNMLTDLLKESLPSFKLGIRMLDETIDCYRKGKINDLQVEIKSIQFLRSGSLGVFGDIACEILDDEIKLQPESTANALYQIHLELRKKDGTDIADKKIEQFLANAATLAWPSKGLVGAIYG